MNCDEECAGSRKGCESNRKERRAAKIVGSGRSLIRCKSYKSDFNADSDCSGVAVAAFQLMRARFSGESCGLDG